MVLQSTQVHLATAIEQNVELNFHNDVIEAIGEFGVAKNGADGKLNITRTTLCHDQFQEIFFYLFLSLVYVKLLQFNRNRNEFRQYLRLL